MQKSTMIKDAYTTFIITVLMVIMLVGFLWMFNSIEDIRNDQYALELEMEEKFETWKHLEN